MLLGNWPKSLNPAIAADSDLYPKPTSGLLELAGQVGLQDRETCWQNMHLPQSKGNKDDWAVIFYQVTINNLPKS